MDSEGSYNCWKVCFAITRIKLLHSNLYWINLEINKNTNHLFKISKILYNIYFFYKINATLLRIRDLPKKILKENLIVYWYILFKQISLSIVFFYFNGISSYWKPVFGSQQFYWKVQTLQLIYLSLSVSLSSPHAVTFSFSSFFPLIIFVHITEEKAE